MAYHFPTRDQFSPRYCYPPRSRNHPESRVVLYPGERPYHTARESPYPIIHERPVPEAYYSAHREESFLPDVPYQNIHQVTYQAPPEPHQSFHEPAPYQLQVSGFQNPVGPYGFQPAPTQHLQARRPSNSPNQSLSDLIQLDNPTNEAPHSVEEHERENAQQLEVGLGDFDMEGFAFMGDHVEDRVTSTASTLVGTSPAPVRHQSVEYDEWKACFKKGDEKLDKMGKAWSRFADHITLKVEEDDNWKETMEQRMNDRDEKANQQIADMGRKMTERMVEMERSMLGKIDLLLETRGRDVGSGH